MLAFPEREWIGKANCRGADNSMFFAGGKGSGEKTGCRPEPINQALALCRCCKVQQECLEYALHHEMSGVWGGMTESQRRKERNRRNIILKTPSAL